MIQYATFWVRVKAFLWDYLLIVGYLILVTLIFVFLPIAQLFENRIFAQATGFLLITFPITLYYAFSESSVKQGAFGKQKQYLKIGDEHRNRISFVKALFRNVLKFLPWEISHTIIWQIQFYPDMSSSFINIGFGFVYLFIGLNIVSVFITKTKQTLYDLITKTFVVKI